MGLSLSQAIKIFAKAVVNYGGIPFALRAKQPNVLTAKAIDELEAGQGQTAASVDEILESLGAVKLYDA